MLPSSLQVRKNFLTQVIFVKLRLQTLKPQAKSKMSKTNSLDKGTWDLDCLSATLFFQAMSDKVLFDPKPNKFLLSSKA